MKNTTMPTCCILEAGNPISAKACLGWLQTAPVRDLVGYVQINGGPPHQITCKNRHIWERVMIDLARESRQAPVV